MTERVPCARHVSDALASSVCAALRSRPRHTHSDTLGVGSDLRHARGRGACRAPRGSHPGKHVTRRMTCSFACRAHHEHVTSSKAQASGRNLAITGRSDSRQSHAARFSGGFSAADRETATGTPPAVGSLDDDLDEQLVVRDAPQLWQRGFADRPVRLVRSPRRFLAPGADSQNPRVFYARRQHLDAPGVFGFTSFFTVHSKTHSFRARTPTFFFELFEKTFIRREQPSASDSRPPARDSERHQHAASAAPCCVFTPPDAPPHVTGEQSASQARFCARNGHRGSDHD